jgi:hypothetical protein
LDANIDSGVVWKSQKQNTDYIRDPRVIFFRLDAHRLSRPSFFYPAGAAAMSKRL